MRVRELTTACKHMITLFICHGNEDVRTYAYHDYRCYGQRSEDGSVRKPSAAVSFRQRLFSRCRLLAWRTAVSEDNER